MLIWNHQDIHFETAFDLNYFGPLLIQKEGGDFNRNLRMNRGRIFFHGLFLNNPQDLQCR
jgi:hypothetical protein